MSARPGGLTALAVINFILSGLSLLFNGLALGALVYFDGRLPQGDDKYVDVPAIAYVGLCISLVAAGLLIASGIGYLQLKKFFGRTLGNAYALMSLLGSGLGLAFESDKGSVIVTLLFVIYPVLTLILLNTTFRDDFAN